MHWSVVHSICYSLTLVSCFLALHDGTENLDDCLENTVFNSDAVHELHDSSLSAGNSFIDGSDSLPWHDGWHIMPSNDAIPNMTRPVDRNESMMSRLFSNALYLLSFGYVIPPSSSLSTVSPVDPETNAENETDNNGLDLVSGKADASAVLQESRNELDQDIRSSSKSLSFTSEDKSILPFRDVAFERSQLTPELDQALIEEALALRASSRKAALEQAVLDQVALQQADLEEAAEEEAVLQEELLERDLYKEDALEELSTKEVASEDALDAASGLSEAELLAEENAFSEIYAFERNSPEFFHQIALSDSVYGGFIRRYFLESFDFGRQLDNAYYSVEMADYLYRDLAQLLNRYENYFQEILNFRAMQAFPMSIGLLSLPLMRLHHILNLSFALPRLPLYYAQSPEKILSIMLESIAQAENSTMKLLRQVRLGITRVMTKNDYEPPAAFFVYPFHKSPPSTTRSTRRRRRRVLFDNVSISEWICAKKLPTIAFQPINVIIAPNFLILTSNRSEISIDGQICPFFIIDRASVDAVELVNNPDLEYRKLLHVLFRMIDGVSYNLILDEDFKNVALDLANFLQQPHMDI